MERASGCITAPFVNRVPANQDASVPVRRRGQRGVVEVARAQPEGLPRGGCGRMGRMECELMFMLAIWVANFNTFVCGLLASGPWQPARRDGAMTIAAM